MNGADARQLATHLAQFERVSMGLEGRQAGDLLPVARTLLEL